MLQRADGKTILVDGGRARTALAWQVSGVASSIDVVVCTHADADHAEGLIGLLESSLVPVGEVWLPGRWSSRLKDLCCDPWSFLNELCENVSELGEKGTLEAIADAIKPKESAPEESDIGILENALEDESVEGDLLSEAAHHLFCLGGRSQLWSEAVQTAVRIRNVARAAHHHGARIRWFDFDECKKNRTPSGGEPFLKPLNSVELTKQRARLGALDYLALSIANRESLVFLAPETENDSPVIFAADSDLDRVCVPSSTRRIAVTAPHHGSEANRVAYAKVSAFSSDVVWVRSDGNYKKRPGQTFLDQAARVCTLCRKGGASKQTVRLDDTPSGWDLATDVRPCRCTPGAAVLPSSPADP